MKHLTLQLLFIILTIELSGQVDLNYSKNCYNIQFSKKGSNNSNILPEYQDIGFLIVENGVYDFVIDGKKYFQSLLLKLDENGFWITKNWEFIGEKQIINDSIHFSLQQDLKIRCLSIDKGVGGLPFKMDDKGYNIDLVKGDKYCRIKNAVIKTGKEVVMGHYYFTAYGWKNLKIVKGKPYLCEETGEYILRRK